MKKIITLLLALSGVAFSQPSTDLSPTSENPTTTGTGIDTEAEQAAFKAALDSMGIVKSASFTADNQTAYVVVANATVTDPTTPVEGEGFSVYVRNGTATVGGTGYSTVGTIIRRIYHSGAWGSSVSYPYDPAAVAITGGTITGITDLAIVDGGTGASNGPDALTNLGVSAYGQTLVDDADAATARATLGLDSMATQAAGSVAITGGSITGITDLAVADGGTGASTAGDALTNLGLSAYGQTLVDDANAITARNTLELGTSDQVAFERVESEHGILQLGKDGGLYNGTIDFFSAGAGFEGTLDTKLLSADRLWRFPDLDGTIILDDAAQTLTNKTLDGSNTVNATALDLDGATDIGADLADADLILVDDAASGTNRKGALSRFWTYIEAKIDADTIIAGDKEFSGTDLRAPSQVADDPDSLMTRSLQDDRMLLAYLHGIHRFELEVDFWDQNLTGSGSTGNTNGALKLDSGTTTGSTAQVNSTSLSAVNWQLATGDGRGIVDWSKRTAISFKVFGVTTDGADTIVRLMLGQAFNETTATDFVAADKGIGIKIVANDIFTQVANGSTLTTQDSGSNLPSINEIDLTIESDGTGNWALFVNGSEVDSGTGAPTGNGSSRDNALTMSVDNGTSTDNARLRVSQIKTIQIP